MKLIYEATFLHRYGNWGICFTYATWFALRGLAAAAKTYHNCLAVCKEAGFLLKLQLDDGDWGENYLSCKAKENFDMTSLKNRFMSCYHIFKLYLP